MRGITFFDQNKKEILSKEFKKDNESFPLGTFGNTPDYLPWNAYTQSKCPVKIEKYN